MRLYNICTDETDDVTLSHYLRHLTVKFFKHDVPRWLLFSAVVPAKQVCRRCVESTVAYYLLDRSTIKYYKSRISDPATPTELRNYYDIRLQTLREDMRRNYWFLRLSVFK
jgi:hypothetical protein